VAQEQEIAQKLGARVMPVKAKGYGSALRGGIEAAFGKWIIMGDADDSYDFSNIGGFVRKLREGFDLVMGCRMPRGGGIILPGAMPWKNRWLGNPVFSFIGRLLFKCPAQDFHCGLRGFSKAAYEKMELQTTGMEFASEMVIKSTFKSLRITEVPITFHKDGRSRPPHLKPWRDGWRHLRFMLVYSPQRRTVRSASGRHRPFIFMHVSMVGPHHRFEDLREGLEIGYDVSWTSKGLRVRVIRIPD
jgi:glycosyltransferase involved in cell wall biosynthesis